jgi:hypothetical protein
VWQAVYKNIMNGQLEDYDPWLVSQRTNTAGSFFRSFQGWLALTPQVCVCVVCVIYVCVCVCVCVVFTCVRAYISEYQHGRVIVQVLPGQAGA